MIRIEVPATETADGVKPLCVYGQTFAVWYGWFLGAFRRYHSPLGMIAKAYRMAEAACDAERGDKPALEFTLEDGEWHAICAELNAEKGPACGIVPPLMIGGADASDAIAVHAWYPFAEALLTGKPVEC